MLEVRLDPDPGIVSEGAAISSSVKMQPPLYTIFSCAMPKLGLLNPYNCGGRAGIVTGLDLASFDAIGFNTTAGDLTTYSSSTAQIAFEPTNVHEPASWAMMIAGFGLAGEPCVASVAVWSLPEGTVPIA